MLRENNRVVGVEHEQHTCGVFPRDAWLNLLQQIGFEAKVVQDSYDRDIFVAQKTLI